MNSRVKLAVLLGFVGAMLISRPSVTMDEGFALWFVYVIVTGLIIQTPNEPNDWRIIVAAISSGVVLVMTLCGRWLISGVPPHISGQIQEEERLIIILLGLIPVSGLGIWVASGTNEILIPILKQWKDLKTSELEQIASKIKATLAIIIAVFALFAYVVSSDENKIEKIAKSISTK